MKYTQTIYVLILSCLLIACANHENAAGSSSNDSGNTVTADAADMQSSGTPHVKEEEVIYTADSVTLKGFMAYDANRQGKRPVVLVVHEWWGLNDYVRNRTRQLAEMGYLAMAVDMFGNGRNAANPQEAMALAGPFYQHPQLAKSRLEAAFAKLTENGRADPARAAAIGYCYGGYVVLNAAKLGTDLDGVVSFHGGLGGAPPKKNMNAKVLICHGGADNFVPQAEVDAFKKSMDSAGASYRFTIYPNATHAFTNPDATATGEKFQMPIRYNSAADSASWNDMRVFLREVLQ